MSDRRRPRRQLPEAKTCASCGRRFEWRRAWADDWDEVRYCSKGCRRHRPGPTDRALEAAIVDLLASRAASATICPSEAARLVAAGGRDDDGADEAWRALMEPARAAARRLHAADTVEIRQQRRRVDDPSRAKGPIRIGRGPAWDA